MIDSKKLADIYERHNRELLIFISGFLGNREIAEDILHDAFVRLIKYSRDHGLVEANLRALLYRIARNLCIDHLRKNRKNRESRLNDNVEYASGRREEEHLELKELRSKIDDIVSKRSPLHRSVYIMRTELDMTYGAIAQNLGISERTAKRKMKEMFEFLAHELQNSGFHILLLCAMALLLGKIVI